MSTTSAVPTGRRRSPLDEGTSLLLAASPIERRKEVADFMDFTGIGRDGVLVSPLVSIPLPMYNFAVRHPGSRRWPGTKAESMWHPLMWLPQRLAGRFTYPDPETGQPVRESDALWAIRVALELSLSGIYDVGTGSWLDVLATVDLDADDPFDIARVEDWLHGADDPVLDGIDLEELLQVEPPHWGLDMALGLHELISQAAWSVAAGDLMERLVRVMARVRGKNGKQATVVEALDYLDAIALHASVHLRDVPVGSMEDYEEETGLSAVDALTHDDGYPLAAGPVASDDFFDTFSDWTQEKRARETEQPGSVQMETVRAALVECGYRIHLIQGVYLPYLEAAQQLHELGAEGEGDEDPVADPMGEEITSTAVFDNSERRDGGPTGHERQSTDGDGGQHGYSPV